VTDGGVPDPPHVFLYRYDSYRKMAEDRRRLEQHGYSLWSGMPAGNVYQAVYVPGDRLHDRSLKWYFGAVFDDVRSIVNRYDPYGLLRAGAPSDEYESEISHFLLSLRNAQSEQEAMEFLRDELSRSLGALPASKQEAFEQMGHAIWRTWIVFHRP
jgi:hypothetical protein